MINFEKGIKSGNESLLPEAIEHGILILVDSSKLNNINVQSSNTIDDCCEILSFLIMPKYGYNL